MSNPTTLNASHPHNTSALRSGAFSRDGRPLEPRAEEIAQAIMSTGVVAEVDWLGALELGNTLALAEAIDRDLQNEVR